MIAIVFDHLIILLLSINLSLNIELKRRNDLFVYPLNRCLIYLKEQKINKERCSVKIKSKITEYVYDIVAGRKFRRRDMIQFFIFSLKLLS